MTIDEAIEMKKKDNAFNKSIGCDTSYEEQIVEWLEELKTIKGDGFTDDLLNMGFTKGYNKALDDFVNVCKKQFATMYGQRYVDMRDIVNIAEQLKAGLDNDD